MPFITRDDFIELASRIRQRGWKFIFSKLKPSGISRTVSSFDDPDYQNSNWWIIPACRERWNEKITGSKSVSYEKYVLEKYLAGRSGLRMLSLGSGNCSHELIFARSGMFAEVLCVDIASSQLKKAEELAHNENLDAIRFKAADVNRFHLPEKYYDIVLFHSSLHHFNHVRKLLKKVSETLKSNGIVVALEYVGPNRLRWTKEQLDVSNRLISGIPDNLRMRYMSSKIKTSVTGPGWLRMIMSDPSEAVESEQIIPALHENFNVLEEKKVGGNILTLVLKDMAHNFLSPTPESSAIIENLFKAEDEFLDGHSSDLIFGVYSKKASI